MSRREFDQLTFVHHLTHHYSSDESAPFDGFLYGSTLWVAVAGNGRCIALSFDFQRIQPGVLVIADMLGISSNAVLVQDDLSGLPSDSLRLVTLVKAVHGLGWQSTVAEQLPPVLIDG